MKGSPTCGRHWGDRSKWINLSSNASQVFQCVTPTHLTPTRYWHMVKIFQNENWGKIRNTLLWSYHPLFVTTSHGQPWIHPTRFDSLRNHMHKKPLAHSKSWNNNYIQQNETQLFIFSLFMNVATPPIAFIIILPTRKRSLPENGVHNGKCIVHQHCVFL